MFAADPLARHPRRGDQRVIGGGIGRGGPVGEVSQPPDGLEVDVAIPVIVERDLHHRTIDIRCQRHRADAGCALVAPRERAARGVLPVGSPRVERRQARVVAEADPTSGPALVVEIDGGEKPRWATHGSSAPSPPALWCRPDGDPLEPIRGVHGAFCTERVVSVDAATGERGRDQRLR